MQQSMADSIDGVRSRGRNTPAGERDALLGVVVHRGGLHRGVSSYRIKALEVERHVSKS